MILLASGDFAEQKEILEQDRGLSLYCFFEERRPLFGDDPPVSVVYSVVSAASSTIRMRSPIHRMTGTAMLLPNAL